MNYYLLIDVLFAIIIVAMSYYFYIHKLYEKLFEYFKLFLLLTISAKLASYMGYLLTKTEIIQADSYSVLILISFAINFLILFFSYATILQFIDKFIDSKALKALFAKLITVIEVLFICTLFLYILMQIKISKQYIYPHLQKSFTYPYVHKFYKKFLDYDFVYMIISSDTNVNHKEVIFKSLKNAL